MQNKRKTIYLVGFLSTIPVALISYINSTYIGSYVSYNVGILYIIASILSILLMLEMPRVLSRWGNRSTTIFFSFVIFLSLILLSLSSNTYIIVSAFILNFVAGSFFFASLDIFVEDFSLKSPTGTLRGLYLTMISGAWVFAQLISGTIINISSFRGVYLVSALFMVPVLFIFLYFIKNFQDPQYVKVPIRKTIISFLKNDNLFKIYFINLILKLFFAWMIIYTPIYLHEYIGFEWDNIALIFTFMLLPFVLLDFVLGKLSDRIGERQFLIYGFFICGVSTVAIPLLATKQLWMWAIVLFMTRVGAATIEVMSESYFFKSIKEENTDALSFFRNTGPVSYVIGPLLAIPILLFVPSFEYLFFVLSAVLFGGMFISFRLKDVL